MDKNNERIVYKDIEWLNFTITTQVNELTKKNRKDVIKAFDSVIATILGLILSIGVGYVTTLTDSKKQVTILIGLGIACILFLLFWYIVIKLIGRNLIRFIKWICNRINGINPNKELESNEILIDQFNYILVSKLLLAESFMKKASNENEMGKVRHVALSESIYYIKAVLKNFHHDYLISFKNFKNIIEYKKDECNMPNKITLFRIKEILALIESLLQDAKKMIQSDEIWKHKEILFCENEYNYIISKLNTYIAGK